MKNLVIAISVGSLIVFYSLSQAMPFREWGTYYGGKNNDVINDIAIDKLGNIYVVGETYSSDSIAKTGFDISYNGNSDGFIAKFSSTGQLLWASYYGGSSTERFYSIAIDSLQNLVVCGATGSTNLATAGVLDGTFNGGSLDALLVKFSPAGNRLWSTYYGGPGRDDGYNVAVDLQNNIYLTGQTDSMAGIATNTMGVHDISYNGNKDVFVVKIDSAGKKLFWATYYGGSDTEDSSDLTLIQDADGNSALVVVGETKSTSGIVKEGVATHQKVYGGGSKDGFIAKFSQANGSLINGTYYGGSGNDSIYCSAADSAGMLYVGGSTQSPGPLGAIGTFNGVHQPVFSGGLSDGLAAKFDSQLNRQWGTYYGGSGFESVYDIKVDSSGQIIYLAGKTSSTSSIATFDGYDLSYNDGVTDGFFVKLSGSGHRFWGTYYGGEDHDEINVLSINFMKGIIYIAGSTGSTTKMIANSAQDKIIEGGEGLLVKFNLIGGIQF